MSDHGNGTAIVATETVIDLPRSRSAVAALVLGIVGLLLYPLGIASMLAIAFGLAALPQIRAGRARGRGMVIAGMILGMIGIVAMMLVWAVFISQFASRPAPTMSSAKIAPEGMRYLKNRATILNDFAQGVSAGRFEKGQMTSHSSTTDGRKDSIDIYGIEGWQTAPGFRIWIQATAVRRGDALASGIRGNLFLVSKGSVALPLPTAARTPSDRFTQRRQPAYPLPVPIAYAADAGRLVYGTADPPGGRIVVEGNQVTLLDGFGRTQGQYTFADLDGQGAIQEVFDRQVPAPDDTITAQKCQGGSSVDNAFVFATHRSTQEDIRKNGRTTSKSETVRLAAQKVASYDCLAKQLNLHVSIDFSAEIDGSHFQGIAFIPIPISFADMAQIESRMKQDYVQTGRQLTTLQCARQGRVSFRDSPIKCKATDSEDNSLSVEVTVNPDGSPIWAWGPIIPPNPDMAAIKKTIKDKYLAQTNRQLTTLQCPREGRVSLKDSPIKCAGTDSRGGRLKFVITINQDTSYRWVWERSLPRKVGPPSRGSTVVLPKVKPSPSRPRVLPPVAQPAPSQPTDSPSMVECSAPTQVHQWCIDRSTGRTWCPSGTVPAGYDSEGRISYCLRPGDQELGR